MVLGLLMKKNWEILAQVKSIFYLCTRLTYGNAILFAKWGIVP